MRGQRKTETRDVPCVHCGGPNTVSRRAMSIFCQHCRKRLILEDYVIKSYQGLRSYSTCGDIVIERTGRIMANTHACNLTVRGKLEGDVHALGCVEVVAEGELSGHVSAGSLKVVDGAMLTGFCDIRPIAERNARPVKAPKKRQLRQPGFESEASDSAPAGVKAISTNRRRKVARK